MESGNGSSLSSFVKRLTFVFTERKSMALQHRKIMIEDEFFKHYFLCSYIPKSTGSDRLSQSLLSFKNGHPPHRKAWMDCAVSEVKKIKDLHGAMIIRALGHDELIIAENSQGSLDQLSVKIAHSVGGDYRPDYLQKTKPIEKLISLNKAQREAVLHGAYRFHVPNRRPKNILIVDDILTSGATVSAMISAVLKALPSVDISIFTLASTDYNTQLNENVTLKSSPYRWVPESGWMIVQEDSERYAETLTALKGFILNNSFE